MKEIKTKDIPATSVKIPGTIKKTHLLYRNIVDAFSGANGIPLIPIPRAITPTTFANKDKIFSLRHAIIVKAGKLTK
jgi:hypothetical protein